MPVPAALSRLRLPVIAAPMFLVSGTDLVIAESRAGICGSLPSLNARPQDTFDTWLTEIETGLAGTSAPYAVNLVAHRSNDRLLGDLETCVRHKVPLLLTSLQSPGEVVAAAHTYGGLVFHDVISLRHAEKALEAGVDGLILVCAGAGGHGGALSPFALIQEVRRIYSGPLVLAGAITNGASILAAQAMGADLVYIGTRFIATTEATAAPAYKQMLVDTTARDIVYTNLFSGVHGNYLAPTIAAAGLDPAHLPTPEPGKTYVAGHKREKPQAWRDIGGAGQGVGGITSIDPVATVIDRLETEYHAAWARMNALHNTGSTKR